MATTKRNKLPSVLPGEILVEEFMRSLGLSANKLSLELHVPSNRIVAIVHGERSVTAETALRLARRFGNSAEFWMNLQARYDLEKTSDKRAEKIEREVRTLEPGVRR
jgi:addiction module HigA family antidote